MVPLRIIQSLRHQQDSRRNAYAIAPALGFGIGFGFGRAAVGYCFG
jgi:hypothetical protein